MDELREIRGSQPGRVEIGLSGKSLVQTWS